MAGGAILDLNPSLVQYVGGYGRAAQALGNSMVGMGQLDIDAKKQIEDERIKNATLKIAQDTQALQQSNADYTKQKDFETKNDKLAANAATNAFLLGQEAPIDAKLSLIDPTITAAALKGEKEKFAGTANGLIYNVGTGQIAGDYRDKSEGSGFGAKGVTHVDTIKNGQVMRTFINPQTGETKSVMIGGTPTGIAGMAYGDALQDNNTYQRPAITNQSKQDIGGTNVVANGGMPIALDANPKIAAKQREWALPIEGGGWYVPRNMTERYKKAFPR